MTTKRRKNIRLSIALPEKEAAKLSLYAAEHGVGRAAAMRKILKEHLKSYTVDGHNEVRNQISLFDSLQMDIFNNTSVTKSTNENQ